ncbi:hypothetical protein DFH08DRAFT_711041 [Mycena albidolilacea]|uniref:Uncharacterized protein n=1 Tax=Mycena albidolilacea TaxID=1033008 RepID=A0AAD7EI01_9AGAR|nr:hypothetical protein DFH08DRAFT_711041 [Mycena albidolilacea]
MSFFSAARRDPALQDLSFTHVSTFIHLLSVLKDDILLCQPHHVPTNAPPPLLLPSIHLFASNTADIPYDLIPSLWLSVQDDIWALSDTKLSSTEQDLFCTYGWRLGLGEYQKKCSCPY